MVHKEIFNLLYHSNGFTHTEVYQMPVYLRKYYLKLLQDQREFEKNASKKDKTPISNDMITPSKIQKPG